MSTIFTIITRRYAAHRRWLLHFNQGAPPKRPTWMPLALMAEMTGWKSCSLSNQVQMVLACGTLQGCIKAGARRVGTSDRMTPYTEARLQHAPLQVD